MQRQAVWQIPDPDYERHPAYGGLFGRPRAVDRLRALARVLPHVGAYAAYELVSRFRFPRSSRGRSDMEGASPVARALFRDGAVPIRFTEPEMARIHRAFAPHVATLRAKMRGEAPATPGEAAAGRPASALDVYRRNGTLSALHQKLNPNSNDNEIFIHEAEAPEPFEALRAAFRAHGALDAASRYQGRPLDVRYLKLIVNDASDAWWRSPFADVKLPDPPAIQMHVDHLWTAKAVLYLTEVGEKSGPFCYCLGSNHVRIGWLEGAARRANDRVELSSCRPAERRMFSALPKLLRRKAKFGNDLENDHPAIDRLLASEKRFTSKDGQLILFDDRGIHRGGMLEDGERIMVQIRLA